MALTVARLQAKRDGTKRGADSDVLLTAPVGAWRVVHSWLFDLKTVNELRQGWVA